MNKWLRYLLVFLFIIGLILVRKFEDNLFYDPFLAFFKGDYLHNPFPEYDLGRIATNVIFRYSLNTLLSLLIIGTLFWDRQKVKFAFYVMCGFLVLLLPLYLYLIEIRFSLGENFGFYVRRFLIQPMLLLVLIPAFYYHQYLSQKSQ